MKKRTTFYLCFCVCSTGFSLNQLFDHKTWAKNKETIKQQIKNREANILEGENIIGLDFSDMDLTGKDLTNCKFIKVNLQGADLTDTIFYNTHFDKCNLIGAFFRYTLEGSSVEKVFKVTTNQHDLLIEQYSDLMNKKERKEKAGLKEEAADLLKQTQYLNHLFGALKLNLKCMSLNMSLRTLHSFNLIDINFKDADLSDTCLKGARLSKDFTIPYNINNKYFFDTFKEAVNNNTPEKPYLLKLFNNKFHIFHNISNENLRQINWKGFNLENTYLASAQLYDLDLEGVNFKGANLKNANLRNTNLINANFQDVDLSSTNLREAKFSEDFQLNYNYPSDLFDKWYNANINGTPDKKYYNILVANRFDLFEDISKESILNIIEKKLDLKNAYLKSCKLIDVKLSGANLENTVLFSSSFNKSILSDINLKNSDLFDTDFQNTQLSDIIFDLSCIQRSKFNQSILNSVSFKGASLFNSDFTDTKLTNVDFFAADIRALKLSENTQLPHSYDDQDHINFYHNCTDEKAKALLKIILESRGHILEPKEEEIES